MKLVLIHYTAQTMHQHVPSVGTTQPCSPVEMLYMGLDFARHDMPA
jgi:hypothetical protein